MSTVLLDQIEEIADEYKSDEEIEQKILEDLAFAIKMEIYQRRSATDFEDFDAAYDDYDGD